MERGEGSERVSDCCKAAYDIRDNQKWVEGELQTVGTYYVCAKCLKACDVVEQTPPNQTQEPFTLSEIVSYFETLSGSHNYPEASLQWYSKAACTLQSLTTRLQKAEAKLVFHNHRSEAAHNEGQQGMPQGDCGCPICRPFYAKLQRAEDAWKASDQRIAALVSQLQQADDAAVKAKEWREKFNDACEKLQQASLLGLKVVEERNTFQQRVGELEKDRERLDCVLDFRNPKFRLQKHRGYNTFSHEHEWESLSSREQIDVAIQSTQPKGE